MPNRTSLSRVVGAAAVAVGMTRGLATHMAGMAVKAYCPEKMKDLLP